MLKILTMAAVTGLLANSALAAPAMDAQGKCRDNGKFVSAALCKAPAASARCRDIKTKKFAKCTAPGVEPVPAKK